MLRISQNVQSVIEGAGAKIRVGYLRWLRIFLAEGVVAITLGRRIYLAGRALGSDVEGTLRHELEHVMQINRLGLVRFYFQYLMEYIRNRLAGLSASQAYREISFEREARAAEEAFRTAVV